MSRPGRQNQTAAGHGNRDRTWMQQGRGMLVLHRTAQKQIRVPGVRGRDRGSESTIFSRGKTLPDRQTILLLFIPPRL